MILLVSSSQYQVSRLFSFFIAR